MSTATTPVLIDNIPPEQLKEIRLQLESTIRKELVESNAVELTKLKDDIRKENDRGFQEAIQKFEEDERKRRQPLTPQELQKLLSKEYITFTVELQDDSGNKHPFTLKELPQGMEEDLYSMVKNSLSELTREYSGFSFKEIVQGDILQNIMGLMDLFSPMQGVLAKCCVICLDPRKKLEWLNVEWVKNNLSNYRIITILLAQVEVNKMRDFFSLLFSGFQGSGIDQASTQQ